MKINTHTLIDQELCGTPLHVDSGCSRVELRTTRKMIVDETGLVHGGFIFGLADYAAMIAVNHPNVVLGASEVKFIKPVKVDERVVAEATVENPQGKKQVVTVTVSNQGEIIFTGTFTCFVLDKHVLK
ncbi:MAG: PaaI family thioesterase [Deltaproteobacteria bacterium]|nr:PaaI family thioesterase [Deltaproteobacteria bacterium]